MGADRTDRTPPTPGDDMTAISLAETTRIASLLDRLDPAPGSCEIPGCLHLHEQSSPREDAPALAA
jgi:hypothetical protein